MTLLRIIRIEERTKLPKDKNFCKVNGTDKWVLFTDITTKSTGIMTEHQLNESYEKMVGFSYNGKDLYIEVL